MRCPPHKPYLVLPRAPGCDSAGPVQRSFPTSEVSGSNGEELSHVGSQGRWRRGATPRPRSGAAAGKSNPTSIELLLRRRKRGERNHATFKVRKGNHEKILLVLGKEQRPCFSGAAMKRYQGKRSPSKTVGIARGHQRADTLKP